MNFEHERECIDPILHPQDANTSLVREMLYAFGDDKNPLDETARVLDEIATDFLIETCHTAAKSAEYSGRTKIKLDDFKFAIRGDELLTGRHKELLSQDKVLKDARKQIADIDEGKVGLERGGRKRKEDKIVEKEATEGVAKREVHGDEELGDEDE